LSQAKEEKNFQPAKEKPMPHNRSKQFRTLMAFFLGLMIVAILAVGILGIAWAQHLEGPGRPRHHESIQDAEEDMFWILQLM
jgi:hypothetical protein